MRSIRHTGRRWAGAVVLSLASIAIGAVFATSLTGTAAIAVAPSNTSLPTISGTDQPGSTLTAATGNWSGTTPLTYTYSWLRCNASGSSCNTIGGANGSTYALQDADAGSKIEVTVTATNADGTAHATSAQTPLIGLPDNTAAPSISGTAQQGQTLTASNGTWVGVAPVALTYTWSRCDQNGNNCAAIQGATNQSYQLQSVDLGNTLRVTVTGTNTIGSLDAQSAATGVVGAQTAATGCPSGTGTIQIADLAPPARLAIDQQTVTPSPVTPSTKSIQIHARVTACGGRPVQGALVYETAVPYNQFSIPPEGTTGADGTVVLTSNMKSGFPAAKKQELLVVFLRARKAGEPLTAGISTRLLVSFHVSLK